MHYCRDEETEAWALCSSCKRFMCVSLCYLPQLDLNSLVKLGWGCMWFRIQKSHVWNLIGILKNMKIWNLMTEEMFDCDSRTPKPTYTGISALWHESTSYLYYILGFTVSLETMCLQLQHLWFIEAIIPYFNVMSSEANGINHVLWWTQAWRQGRVCEPRVVPA